MKRHPLRWTGLAFGLLFLFIAGNWAVWEQDLLTQRQFNFTLSGLLIVFGTVGVIATFWRPAARPSGTAAPLDTQAAPLSDHDETPKESHEEPDPQP